MLNDFDEAAQDEEKQHQMKAEVATGVGVSLTAGFVSWALRAGSMAASFLAAMQTWDRPAKTARETSFSPAKTYERFGLPES